MSRTTVRTIADKYVAALATTSPSAAEALGQVPEILVPDLSPQAAHARNDLQRRTLHALRDVPAEGAERVLAVAMRERLASDLALDDVGFTPRLLAPLATPVHQVRQVFDNLPTGDSAEVDRVLANLERVPTAYAQYREALTAAAADGHVVPSRQARIVAQQCRTWIDPAGADYYTALADRAAEHARDARAVRRAAEAATTATAELADWLEHTHARLGSEQDGVGIDFYEVTSKALLGTVVDLEETYAYGWARLAMLTREVQQVSRRITGGNGGLTEATAILDADSPRVPVGPLLVDWIQQRIQASVDAVDGTVFDLPDAARHCEGRLSTPGSGVIYYSPPDIARTRPGRVYWSTPPDAETMPVWREVSTVHHEGVPGHHLQYAISMSQPDLHPWQRYLCHVHGYAEGWAHYAEGRAESWGLVHDDADRLSVLLAQRWRAARIVIDIGLHLDLPIPPGNGVTRRRRWTRTSAREVLVQVSALDAHTATFEVDRYLGWPGQALAFCVGARLWEQALTQSRAVGGANFTEKGFHMTALQLGPMGLGPLQTLLTEQV
ncbi:DUF885 domain-containing protein [Ornithinicoccus hortensis]|uniref:Uncharacterized protein (DUF885 family) n=1 Tax=Ornithinicoccus hortensis TaxID=82346 RepID=A0A542YWM3_9MICO|nr:DUF885 domain-containing protein [Ornithinicoccus hortensis]TQL52492.1 uncharacterized protein (DUF885 family) [Ornithinicoccus hortensis]